MNQKGFIEYILIACIAFAGVTGFYGWSKRVALDNCRAEFEKFKADVEANGRLAAAEAKRINAENLAKVEKANAEHEKLLADNAALVSKLRNTPSSRASGRVPKAPTDSCGAPETAEYFARLERAYGVLVARVRARFSDFRAIADEGTAAVIDLNTAKKSE